LQWWFINLTGKGNFIGTVGTCRIQVLRAFLKQGIEYVPVGIVRRIRAIPWLLVTGGKYGTEKKNAEPGLQY